MSDSKTATIKARVTRQTKIAIEQRSAIEGIDESEFIRRSVELRISHLDELQSIRQLIIDQIEFSVSNKFNELLNEIREQRDFRNSVR